jgi:transcriptional regulator with XRE-family HTH domain
MARSPFNGLPRKDARLFQLPLQLAVRSGVAAGMISYVERGQTSPSLATLQKLLAALGSDLGSFFNSSASQENGPVFAREQMPMVADRKRTYTMLLTRRPGIRVEMFDEDIRPSRKKPDFETLTCDVAGDATGKPVAGDGADKHAQVRPRQGIHLRSRATGRRRRPGRHVSRVVSHPIACLPR